MHPKIKTINFSSFIVQAVFILLVYLNFMVWVQVYDFGENLDDKLVSAISSKLFFAKWDGQLQLYNELIEKCYASSTVNSCEARYMYRANTLSNYLIPSFSIRFFEVFFTKILDPLDPSQALSLAFFYGYAIIFLLAAATSIFFANYLKSKTSKVLTLLSLISLTISNPHLFDLSSLSSIFLNVLDSNFYPTVYVPRGAVSILLFPISLAILFNKPKSLLLLLLFTSLMHTGYSQITALVCLATVSAIAIIQDSRYWRIVVLLVVYNTFLMIFIFLQLSFGGGTIIEISLENFSFAKILAEINFEIFLLYLFCAFIICSRRPEILKRATIILLTFHIFLLFLFLLSTVGVLNNSLSGNISDRMNGSFMYVVFTYTIFVMGSEIRHSIASKKKYVSLSLLTVVMFLFINTNITYVYSGIKRVVSYQFISTQINRVFDSHSRFQIAQNDIQLYIKKNYKIDKNQHWLTEKNNNLSLDIQKIKQLNIAQIDVNNEFLTFLYLYKADRVDP